MTRLLWHRLSSRRRGNAVLDAALVLPILLPLTFGSIEYGYYFYIKHCLQGAAREGARAAIAASASYTDVTNAVAASMSAAGVTGYTFTVTHDGATIDASNFSTLASGDRVNVTVKAPWGTVGVRPLGLISFTQQLTAVTVMRKEG